MPLSHLSGLLQEVGHSPSTVSHYPNHPHPFRFFTRTDTHIQKPQALNRIHLACGEERQKQKKTKKRRREKRMEGRSEDKRRRDKRRMSHGHTRWPNVLRKASHTQTHKNTNLPCTAHTHTHKQWPRAPQSSTWQRMQRKSDGCALACESRSRGERQR